MMQMRAYVQYGHTVPLHVLSFSPASFANLSRSLSQSRHARLQLLVEHNSFPTYMWGDAHKCGVYACVCVSVCVCGVNVVSELYTTLVYHRLRQISDMGGDIK